MLVYRTATRNFVVRAINADRVVYDTIFPINKENEFDRKEREIRGVPADVQRNPNRNLTMPTLDFAIMIAGSGYMMQTGNKSLDKSIETAVRASF